LSKAIIKDVEYQKQDIKTEKSGYPIDTDKKDGV